MEQVRFSTEILKQLKESGLRVRKADNLYRLDKQAGPLVSTITLCPLYGQGALSDSSLLRAPSQIEDSRVVAKWSAASQIVTVVGTLASALGREARFNFTFADYGVILGGLVPEDSEALDYHYNLYSEALAKLCEGRSWNIRRYSDLSIEFPQFIRASESASPTQGELTQLSDNLRDRGISLASDAVDEYTLQFTPRSFEIVRKLSNQLGADANFRELIISQYGLFDAQTTQADALNFYLERESAGLLLQLTDIFSHKFRPRIDIIC